ncbi:nucleotide exchange factor GrpE [Sinomicrobium soli]|uniref:nucleotide exchange factor GrpE n=1 Tax=Sinomicrobium sp. N-1-3-6 TaxID=2219864 RepID=UPI000DCAF402|nr:nucleotide exchange factor GrpE [Sinomicrobium sp. N-1-3-6]RAV29954.1 nucleotide exchange factor GrpE [Sinomicrobium sp. N-1-3-6]
MAKKDNNEIEDNKDIAAEGQVAREQEVSAEEELREELGKEKDKFLRLFAEFENYKKRTAKERIELFKTAGQDVVSAMLPVLDDFDRAIAEIRKSADGNPDIVDELLKGVDLISNKFRETLKSKGLTEIEVNQGDAFDAELHEAITQIPAPSEDMKGKIIDVIEKGYRLGEKIIRYPKVVVGN